MREKTWKIHLNERVISPPVFFGWKTLKRIHWEDAVWSFDPICTSQSPVVRTELHTNN